MEHYDVVIVGGAAVGSAAAYFLASAPAFDGRLLVLVDRWRVGLGLEPRHPDLVGDLVREANFPPALRRVRGAMLVAFRDYRPEPYPGRALFLWPSNFDMAAATMPRQTLAQGK